MSRAFLLTLLLHNHGLHNLSQPRVWSSQQPLPYLWSSQYRGKRAKKICLPFLFGKNKTFEMESICVSFCKIKCIVIYPIPWMKPRSLSLLWSDLDPCFLRFLQSQFSRCIKSLSRALSSPTPSPCLLYCIFPVSGEHQVSRLLKVTAIYIKSIYSLGTSSMVSSLSWSNFWKQGTCVTSTSPSLTQ